MAMIQIRRSASIYFAFQGVAVLAWWGLLYLAPESRAYFQMGESESLLLAFWLPDLFLLAAGSLFTSAFCISDNRLIIPAAWFVVGAISYASIFCFSFALKTDTGWLGVTLMLPAMIVGGNFAIALTPAFERMMFRRSKEARTSWILAKTLTQLVVVWALILLIIPLFIVQLETKLGISQFAFPLQKPLSLLVFFAMSSIGVSSAYTMAKIGRGTPLPIDAASKLVVAGTYSYVRNPMAISGISQGLAVGVFHGSILTLLYALLGGLIWQLIFRPLEEADLLKNFGSDYEDYHSNVKCWIPRLTAFEMNSGSQETSAQTNGCD